MKKHLYLVMILFATTVYPQKGEILFFQTNWGNTLSWDAFCERAKASGFDGIDVWLPNEAESQQQLNAALKKHDLKLNLMHGTDNSLPFEESLEAYKKKLYVLVSWKPVVINSQTGSDFFSMEQNTAFIKAANAISKETGIPIYHETHRGRFSYTLPITLDYLKKISDLRLTADISHWMVVHESLLEGRDAMLSDVIAKTDHIHARVGHAESPQVNDPKAPEWKRAVDRHLDIWEKVIRKFWAENDRPMTVTSEFGPPYYMPALPYTQLPVSDQWEANVYMMNIIKQRLGLD
ncbi:sugar phosphate isomerase/epimerase family protein [Flagellimonas alvinocaridis]|nr:sugar phosphate isomerase/epimerase [Allomuricauda alvinocaridis]